MLQFFNGVVRIGLSEQVRSGEEENNRDARTEGPARVKALTHIFKV